MGGGVVVLLTGVCGVVYLHGGEQRRKGGRIGAIRTVQVSQEVSSVGRQNACDHPPNSDPSTNSTPKDV